MLVAVCGNLATCDANFLCLSQGNGKAARAAKKDRLKRGIIKMTDRFSTKQFLMLGTALAGFGILTPTAAFADCLINATNDTVTCTTADTNGFQSAINLLTINVTPGATVSGTTLLSAAPILSAGTQSVVNNEG